MKSEKMRKLFVQLMLSCAVTIGVNAQTFPVTYDFTSNSDTQNLYSGSLQNGASLETLGSYGVLNLGSNDGYFELGSGFGQMIKNLGQSFTVSVDIFVPSTTDISANGNFIWCFSRSSSQGYMFINAKDMRYAITQSSWNAETSVNPATALPKGRWVNIMYVQDGSTGTVYLDNEMKAQNQNVNIFPSSITRALQNNYLGRSCYDGDAYLKDARYADLRIYNSALGSNARATLVATVDELNRLENGIGSEADALAYDMNAINVPKVAFKKITLPTSGEYGTSISWATSDASHLAADGTVVRQETDRDVNVTLTATFTLGSLTQTRQYTVKVKQKEDYSHYLFAFFPSNSNENIYFAVGDDGYNYTTINNDQAVFLAEGNTVMGGLRDPHILRGEDGYFYMVATDMKSALGWASNRGMVLMKSSDLINWTCSTVHFPTKYAGTYLEHVTRVWAPETIYDQNAGKYMIYFSILTDDGSVPYDKVFYCYANADFTDLEGTPTYFYDRGSSTIDMDIVYNEADGLYHAIYKNEGSGGICKVTASSLTPASGQAAGSQWGSPSGRLEQTNEAVEGGGLFRLINDDSWILMYDCYSNGHYQFCSSPDLTNFTFVRNTATSGSFTPRHGTVLPITQAEYDALLAAFPSETLTGETSPDENGNLNLTADRISGLCESTSGWTSVNGFGVLDSNANYVNGEARVNGSFIEKWRGGQSIGENNVMKTLRYLPAGTYKLRASCIATWQPDASVTVTGVSFYADDQTADVHTGNGVPERYTLTFDINSADNYTAICGVQTTSQTNANWVAFDNMRLYFVGTEAQYHTALRAMHDDYIAQAEALFPNLRGEYLADLQAAVAAVDPDATSYSVIEPQLDRLVAAMETARQHLVMSDADAILYDMNNIFVPKVAYKKITLPTSGEQGSSITWATADAAHLTADGTVIHQENDRDVNVTLTGTFTLGSLTQTRQYIVKVKQKEPYQHYLFAFFPNNDDENIYFAVGDDGYNYTTINNDQAVLLAQGNSVMGGFRDPHILRGEDGNFYMVATDMRCALGWTSNRGIVLMKSSDLINWTCSTVHFPTKYAGTYLEHVTRVWAPETIYDKEAGKYMIYFSILTDDGSVSYDKVFYCYANASFTDLEGEPVYFYDRNGATIDMDIVYNEADEIYHAVFASPDNPGIGRTTAETLLPAAGEAAGSQWSPFVAPIQQTNEGVEGAGVFRLINDDNWILMYDCYGNGHYQFCSSPDLENFTFVCNTATGGSFTPRHGTVLPITQAEYEALLAAFPSETLTGEILPDENGNYNLTADRIPQLCESTSGWDTVSNFWLMSSNANYVNGDARVNGAFVERWANNASIGANNVKKTLRYLPAGTYKLRSSCIATRQSQPNIQVSGVTFYADDQTVAVHTSDGVPERYTLSFDINSADNYTTTCGLQTTSQTNANWVAIDNMRLYFVGTEAEYHTALRAMHDDYIAQAEALYEDLCDEYIGALQQAVAAVDPDETRYSSIETQLDRLVAAMETARQHIAATTIMGDADASAPAAKTEAHVRFKRQKGFTQDYWNTLCLPFSMTAAQVVSVFGEGTIIKRLSSATETGGNVNMKFQQVEAIEANTPYLFKPTVLKTAYCINPVNITPSENPVTTISGGLVSFVGVYVTATVLATNDYYLLNNYIYRSPGSTKIKSYRAYFEVPAGNEAKQLNLAGDDETTGIRCEEWSVKSEANVYDITGRKLQTSNLSPGIYIQNGKKILVR